MSWGSIFSIADKFIPGRRERLSKRLHELEEELSEALWVNDAKRIAFIRKEMAQLRERIKNVS